MRSKDKNPNGQKEAMRTKAQASAPKPKKTSRLGVHLFGATVFCTGAAATIGIALAMGAMSAWALVAAIVVGAILTYSIRIAPQWERVVILRFGRFSRQVGPGLYFMIPIVEYAASHVDQ